MVRLSRAYKKKMRGKRKSRKQRGGGCGCAAPMTGGKRRTKRRRRKRTKRVRRTKRKRRKRRKRRRKQKGGNLLMNSSSTGLKCNYPENLGAHFGDPLNPNPYLPDPINNNGNMKGGGVWSDIKNYWWKGNDALTNTVHRYKGAAPKISSDILVQPHLSKTRTFIPNHPDLGTFHKNAATEVSGMM
mgnify:CR=1 FL=1